MAITNGDGSIILTTKVDQTGLNTGINTMKSATTKLGIAFTKLGGYIATTLSVTAFIRFSRAAGQMATQQEANVKRLIDIYGEASQAVGDYIDANARALGMSKSSASSFSAVYGNLFSVWADQKTNAELTSQYLNMTAVVASKSGRTVEDVQERVRSGLLGNTEAIEDLGIFVNVKTIEMTDAFKRLADGRSWEQLGAYEQQQVRTMAILEQATQKYGNQVVESTALTRAQYKAAHEDMQATWGQFVNVVLMPVLKVATQIFDIITAGMRAVAGLTGKTIENANAQSNAISGAADNQKALTDETKRTSKEQKKLLAGFDEINILSQGDSDSSTASDTSTGNTPIVSSAGSSSGNSMAEGINSTLATIMGIVGGALVAIGVLLLFSAATNPMLIGWGIGFIIAGATMLGVSAAAIGDANIDLSTKFSSIMAIVGGFILAIGIVLLLKVPTAQPLALGMIIAGAGILAVSAAQIAADKIGGEVGDMLHGIIAIVSGLLLVIGIILLFTPASLPLAIGLIVAGAVGLATEIALNPKALKNSLQGWLGGILAIVSGALLVLGIILCCCGIVTPISIGMIVAGAAGLATVVALNWNFIVDKIKEIWGKVKSFWNKHIAPVFTKEWWLNLAKKAANGLISGFESGVNGIITLFEKMINWVVKNLNKISFDVPDWVPLIGGKKFGFNLSEVSFKRVSIPRLARGAVIPPNREFMAVLGDQKYGRNLEAPEDLIRQIVREETAKNNPNFIIQANGSLAPLIRLLNLEIQRENKRSTIWG